MENIPCGHTVNKGVSLGSQSFLCVVLTDVTFPFVSWQILLRARKYHSKTLNEDELMYCITIATDFPNGTWLCV